MWLSHSLCEFVRVFVCTHVCICAMVVVEGEKGVFLVRMTRGERRDQRTEESSEQNQISPCALTNQHKTEKASRALFFNLYYGSVIERQQQDRCYTQNESNSCPEVLRLSSVT